MTVPDPPALDRPLGSLDFRLRDEGPDRVVTAGRRVRAHGGATGVQTIRIDGRRVVDGLHVPGAAVHDVVVTPPGVRRTLELNGIVTERLVVSRDAPVAWLEWTPGADRADAAESGNRTLELTWRVQLDNGDDDRAGTVEWHRADRGLWVRWVDDASEAERRTLFAFSAAPEDLAVTESEDGDAGGTEARSGGRRWLEIHARLPLEAGGVRMAVVAAAPGDDLDRALRIAGRTRVAARARAGAADRLLAEGLTLATGSALDEAVAWARLRLADAPAIPPGPWQIDDIVATAEARLMSGDHAPVRALLETLGRLAAAGPPPARGVDERVVDRAPAAAGAVERLLRAYLGWTGDRTGARPVAEALGLDTLDDVRGERAAAADEATDEGVGATAVGRSPSAGVGPDDTDAGTVIRRVVDDLLGAEPDAVRSRLVLRPRPPADGSRFEVRGLVVGPTAVSVEYDRSGGCHRLTVRQTRGAAPLQVVLAPELAGGEVVETRVDGQPAELDTERVGARWRVPVQVVSDTPRTLEVEIEPEGTL